MKARNITVLGLQWGDEGKGKVVDYFADSVDIVARFGGGSNAGHTVVNEQDKFILHLLPTGIIHPGVTCYLGGGMVCDPAALLTEIKDLEEKGIDCRGRVYIDYATHLVLPQHKAIEKFMETVDKTSSIDTTLRGIGPAYADKADRVGITASDLMDEEQLNLKVNNFIKKKLPELEALEFPSLREPQELVEYLRSFVWPLKGMLADVTVELRQAMCDNKRLLFEGAQGAVLDIGLGTYPYVTSSNTTIGGLFSGLGLPPGVQGEVCGVVKAYCTRVGNGPFPSELHDSIGERLRQKGGEYGATTGRPRRTGWLDLAIVRRTAFMSGVTGLIVTKLDVLDGLEEIKVCVAHRYEGKVHDFPPLLGSFMQKAEPVYESLPGWHESTEGISEFEKLPQPAKAYLEFIQRQVEVPVKYVSTGCQRNAFIKIA